VPLIDISVPLSESLPAFPGDPAIRLECSGIAAKPFHSTRLSLGSHAGTHTDHPAKAEQPFEGDGVNGAPCRAVLRPLPC